MVGGALHIQRDGHSSVLWLLQPTLEATMPWSRAVIIWRQIILNSMLNIELYTWINHGFFSESCHDKAPPTGWLKTVGMYSLSFGDQKSKIKVSAGLIPFRGSGRECFLFLSWLLWWSVIPNVPWLVDASLYSLPLLSCGLLSSSVSVFSHDLLIRTPIIGFRARSNPI